MIHSIPDPYRGDWTYWDCPDRVALNDDHPVPGFRNRTDLGVPSTHAARSLPGGCVRRGRGRKPRGVIASHARQVAQIVTGGGGRDPSMGLAGVLDDKAFVSSLLVKSGVGVAAFLALQKLMPKTPVVYLFALAGITGELIGKQVEYHVNGDS